MGTFDIHSDIHDLPGIAGPDGLAAYGLWARCGTWSSRNGRTGIVPKNIVEEFASDDQESIERLVSAGLWEPIPEGYRMLQGSNADPDLLLPLWRYGDDDGRFLFEIDDTPNT